MPFIHIKNNTSTIFVLKQGVYFLLIEQGVKACRSGWMDQARLPRSAHAVPWAQISFPHTHAINFNTKKKLSLAIQTRIPFSPWHKIN
jgi:hypothetical protein